MAGTTRGSPRRTDFGKFLRSKRAALDPRACGLAVSARRRAIGLLREEVAQLAGVSVTWYTWLEQGRTMNPSGEVLDALAGALRLTEAERRHFYRLARPELDVRAASGLSERLTPALAALLDGLSPHPAYAFNGRWDVLAENAPARAVFGSFFGPSWFEGNVLARLLLDPQWESLFVDHARLVESAVAQFRAATVMRAEHPSVQALVHSLRERSPTFASLWERGDVVEPPAWRKSLRHSKAGAMTFDYATFHPDSEPEDIRVTVYTPADDAARAAVARLL